MLAHLLWLSSHVFGAISSFSLLSFMLLACVRFLLGPRFLSAFSPEHATLGWHLSSRRHLDLSAVVLSLPWLPHLGFGFVLKYHIPAVKRGKWTHEVGSLVNTHSCLSCHQCPGQEKEHSLSTHHSWCITDGTALRQSPRSVLCQHPCPQRSFCPEVADSPQPASDWLSWRTFHTAFWILHPTDPQARSSLWPLPSSTLWTSALHSGAFGDEWFYTVMWLPTLLMSSPHGEPHELTPSFTLQLCYSERHHFPHPQPSQQMTLCPIIMKRQ